MEINGEKDVLLAWEALEDAGQTAERLNGSETGVFAGVYNSDYSWLQLAKPESASAQLKVTMTSVAFQPSVFAAGD